MKECTKAKLAESLACHVRDAGDAIEEMAWLYRTHWSAKEILEEFHEREIPLPCDEEAARRLAEEEEKGTFVVLEGFGGGFLPLTTGEGETRIFRTREEARRAAETEAQAGIVVEVPA